MSTTTVCRKIFEEISIIRGCLKAFKIQKSKEFEYENRDNLKKKKFFFCQNRFYT